ncbi:MAG: hypothetical protein GKC03_05615 [Methanomassiliicoccales archaeon]|nr:hypothetical protein [Methanomassiliicoccales archaeon]NYT15508.1 hypothetical protein [Methanomassiliicoccales archaeon]
MKWGLLGVRLGILGINIVIIVIIIMSIVPLATGGMDVDIPEGQTSWTVQDNVISLSQPVRIYNGGFYDFEDFTVHFYLEDSDGSVITDYRNSPVDIDAGKRTTVNINLRIDLNDMGEEGMRNLVFNGTTFNMLVEIDTAYMMKLIWLNVNVSEEMEWEPLIQDYGINEWGIQYYMVGSQMQIDVPYFIEASEMLNDQDVGIDCVLRNDTSVMGNASEQVTLQGYTEGTLSFLLSEEASQWLLHNEEELTFDFQIEVEEVTGNQEYHYHWDPST